jgi:hypothetical protein
MSDETSTEIAPADAPAALTREACLDAVGAHASDVTIAQAKIMADALLARGTTSADAAARIAEMAKTMRGPAQRGPDGRFASTPPAAPSNTGAPVRGNAQGTPQSIKEMNPEDVRRMSPREIHEACLDVVGDGRTVNPYRGVTRSHDSDHAERRRR